MWRVESAIREFGSPVFLEMDVSLYLKLRLVDLEAALLENLDHSGGLGKDSLPGFTIFCRHADHLRVTAKIHVCPLGVEQLAQPSLQWAAGKEVLNVDLLVYRIGFACRQAEVLIVGLPAHQLFMDR